MRLDHPLYLFDSDGSLATTLATFVQDGLADGDTVFIVTTVQRWELMRNQLVNRGVEVESALASKRLLYCDARELLEEFMTAGGPSPTSFDASIGGAVRELAARAHRLRIYGDMVDLLAGCGDFASAHRLEALWNELVMGLPVRLLCGYSASHFDSVHHAEALRILCRCHTEIRSTRDDTRSSVLLEAAGATARG